MTHPSQFILLGCLMTLLTFSPSKISAYGYQPDSEGYAYTESTTAINNSILLPVAAGGAAVIIGVILYSGTSHGHKHHHCHSGH